MPRRTATVEPSSIEAVYLRNDKVYARIGFNSIEEAAEYLAVGQGDGGLAPVGVFIGGEPTITDVYDDPGRLVVTRRWRCASTTPDSARSSDSDAHEKRR